MPQFQDMKKKSIKFNVFDAKKKMNNALSNQDRGLNKFSQNGNTSNMQKYFDMDNKKTPQTYEESLMQKKRPCTNCDASGNHIIPPNKSYLHSLKK